MCRHKTNTTYWFKNEESSKLIWLDMKANLEFKTLTRAQKIHTKRIWRDKVQNSFSTDTNLV